MSGFSLAQTMASMQSHTAALEKESTPLPQQQQQQQHMQASAARGATGEEPFTFLARTLDKVRTMILAELPATVWPKVEIEARLGIFCHQGAAEDERVFPAFPGVGVIELGPEGQGGPPTRFFSGVTRGAFEQMKACVAGLGGGEGKTVEASHLHEIVYTYADKRRLRCPAQNPGSGMLESKRKILDINVALPAASYDLRLTVAVENEEEGVQGIMKGWESRRAKIRTSFKDLLGNSTLGPWSLDFTCVTTLEGDGGGGGGGGGGGRGRGLDEESTEVEMELEAEVLAGWLEKGGEEADKETSRLASRLLDTLKRLNPLEKASPGNVLVPLMMDRGVGGAAGGAPVQEALRQRCVAVLQAAGGGGGGGRHMKFPGTMPVNLCRKDVATVQSGGYWLAEKTDGVRYLLFVLGGINNNQASSYLMDRSMAIFTFPGADGLGQALPAGTVLDGELVYNCLTSSYVFLVFDCLFWGAEPMVGLPFSQRLKAIHAKVLPVYEQGKAGGRLVPGKHLPVVGKKFYRRMDIGKLFERVKEEEGHRVYRDEGCITSYLAYLGLGPKKEAAGKEEVEEEDGEAERVWPVRDCLSRYYHKTDGIVFQPDKPYQCSTDTSFFKWKWMDTVTIDFAITPTPYRVVCGAGAAGSLDLTRQIRLEPLDLMRLRADMSAAHCRIAELGFSVETGFWTYKMLRPDKTDPNYFTTVCTTMLELAEGMEEEEIQYRMMVGEAADDDWGGQVGRMRRAAVGWRLREVEGRKKRKKEEEEGV